MRSRSAGEARPVLSVANSVWAASTDLSIRRLASWIRSSIAMGREAISVQFDRGPRQCVGRPRRRSRHGLLAGVASERLSASLSGGRDERSDALAGADFTDVPGL